MLAAGAIAVLWFTTPWFSTALPWMEGILREFWTRSYSSLESFGLTATFLIKTVVFLALLWFGTKVAISILRTQVLDKTALDEGRKFSLQRIVTYLLFGLGFQTIAKNFASGLRGLFARSCSPGRSR